MNDRQKFLASRDRRHSKASICATLRILVVIALSVSSAFAQGGTNHIAGKTIYFLKDHLHNQWCGYASESRFKPQIQALKALTVGGANFVNGHLSSLIVTETDETGDWAVNDKYTFDKSGKIRTLKRIINVIPGDTSEEQLFAIQNGKAIKQRSIFRDLSTGKATQKSEGWFEPPPVVTKVEEFPFSALIGSERLKVWSKGKACIEASRP